MPCWLFELALNLLPVLHESKVFRLCFAVRNAGEYVEASATRLAQSSNRLLPLDQ